MATKDAASLRKRAQIARANKIMFLWVAGASVIVSASVVVAIMLVQKSAHQQKAIKELKHTAEVLQKNNDNISALEDQLRTFGSNELLLNLRSSDTDNALRVILDALPADANPSALGASLQTKLFGNIRVESVQVMTSDESGVLAEEGEADASAEGAQPQSITFNFSVQGTAAQLKSLLDRLERSIRTIQIVNMKIESGDGGQDTLTAEAKAFYLPAKMLQLQNKDIPRK